MEGELQYKSIQSELEKYYSNPRPQKIHSALQEQILAVLELMETPYTGDEDTKKAYRYWNGRLRSYTPTQIHRLLETAKRPWVKNPKGFFKWVVVKQNAEKFL